MTSTEPRKTAGVGIPPPYYYSTHSRKTSKSSSSEANSIDTPSLSGDSTSSTTPSPTMPPPSVVGSLRDDLQRTHLNGAASASSSTAANPRAYDRKASSPMMPAFMVSAPGKVIVYGEHAVVHGKVRVSAHPQANQEKENI